MGGTELDERAVERWLLRRGVPHLIAGYAPSTDVFTRVWWLLGLVLVAEATVASDRDVGAWANVGLSLAGLALLVAAVALLNRRAGRRPLERPGRLGAPELVAFVVLPALLPLVFGWHLGEAAAVAGGNLALLAVLYVVTGYGVVPLSRWAATELAGQLLDLANLLVRTLPLLALFSMFLFLNAELWQVASDLPWGLLAACCGLLALVGVLFTLLRVPQELEGLHAPATWDEIDRLVDGTPVEGLVHRADAPGPPPLGRRGRANLVLVGLFRLGLQVALVSVLVGAFYAALGVLLVREATIEQWTTTADLADQVVWRGEALGAEVVLSHPLLKVSAFLAAFAGLQVTVSALTDATYRQEFFDDLAGDLEQVLAVRAAYLDAR